jgi:hypothetical protein
VPGDVLAANANHTKTGVGPDGLGLLKDERNAVNDEETNVVRIFSTHPRKQHRRDQRFPGTGRHHENDVTEKNLDEGEELMVPRYFACQDVIPSKLNGVFSRHKLEVSIKFRQNRRRRRRTRFWRSQDGVKNLSEKVLRASGFNAWVEVK